MATASAFDPYVVRSERNRDRKPVQDLPTGNVNSFTGNTYTSQGEGDTNYGTKSTLRLVSPNHYLGYFSTAALILNKTVGTGIFVVPATILAITDSKGLSIVLWLVGGLITWAGLVVYLEYGIRFPLTGGELHYIDIIWGRKPKLLITYMYSFMFVLLSGSQANALVFGASVLQASTPDGTAVDRRLQKLFAILLVGVICQLQALSRINYVRFSNVFAAYKICFLCIITVIGLCALRSERTASAAARKDQYGAVNLSNSFQGSTKQPYAIALALLDIMRVYSGYENANFVLEEVQRPPGDENRVFRRAAKFTIWAVCFFYLMINISLFAACTKEELLGSSDVLSLFFAKVFGASPKTRIASGTLLAVSSAGNVMSVTFAAVRVKQEIARMGILPFPAFWAKSTRLNTPGPALLLHWIFSTVIIIATPLDNENGYLVFSTLFNYARTVVSIVVGLGILTAWREGSPFAHNGEAWRPAGSRSKIGQWLVFPLAIISVLANLFVFALCWAPASLQNTLHTKSRVVPSFVGPVVSMGTFAVGILYWFWDRKIGPDWLGYTTEVLREEREGLVVQMTFERHVSGFAAKVVRAWRATAKGAPRLLWWRHNNDYGDVGGRTGKVDNTGAENVVRSQRRL